MSDATPEPASRWYVIPFLLLMFVIGLGLVYLVRESSPPPRHAATESDSVNQTSETQPLDAELARLDARLDGTSRQLATLEQRTDALGVNQDQLTETQAAVAARLERIEQTLETPPVAGGEPAPLTSDDSTATALSAPLNDARLAELEQRLEVLEQSSADLQQAQAEALASEREALMAEMERLVKEARVRAASGGAGASLSELADELAPLGARFTAQGLRVTLAESELRFPPGAGTLPEGPIESLDRLAALLTKRADLKLRLVGHTDSVGDAEANRTLSEARAAAVRAALIARGIDAERLLAEGAGEDEPIADNASAQGRARNRRVELYLLEAMP